VRQSEIANEEIGIQSVRTPKYPEYSTIESRQRSFATWNSQTVQDSALLAQAGFYYLGIADEVRCFYCDGGLRNWLQNDDPWFEHTRWFPKCPFVMLVKGSIYIKNVLQRTQNSTGQSQATTQASAPTAPMSIDDAMNSHPARDALQMGLNAGRVRLVMQRRLQMTGRPFTSTEALVSAVLDGQIEDEGYDNEEPEIEGQINNQVTEIFLSAVESVYNRDETSQPSTSATEQLESRTVPEIPNPKPSEDTSKLPTLAADSSDERRLKNVECKICMSEEVGVVFLPCGHLLSCVFCAPAISQCPLCRETIRGRVRTFLS
jgi:baculoviral IAP repeat-containing protein 2/3